MMRSWFKKRKTRNEIDPDEILLDAYNSPGFNHNQFEGVIERPISHRALSVLFVLGCIIFVLFIGRLAYLQVAEGQGYYALSENNRLNTTPIFSERGIIFDRLGRELAWNEYASEGREYTRRMVAKETGLAQTIGYVSYPRQDTRGFYWRSDIEGKTGIEKLLNERLSGTNGSMLIEVDVANEVQFQNTMIPPIHGENITLTVDYDVQRVLFEAMRTMAQEFDFVGGAGVIMDVETGALLALANYPEFDAHVMSEGLERERINGWLSDESNPFLNRAVRGLFAPGSTMKPYITLGALQEGVIDTDTVIYSTGRVEIPNRFDPENPAIFRDWRREGHGPTDVFHAIADSVNTFFYAIGGGYREQSGIGIERINDYMEFFKIGKPTGFDLGSETEGSIPSPEWKRERFRDGNWYLGDTYNSAIGQFGFLVTPLQLVRAVGALATDGTLLTPYIVENPRINQSLSASRITEIDQEHFKTMREAMRQTVTDGTGRLVDLPYVSVAVKTGTAQTGPQNRFIHSWSSGFWPTEDPRFAFVIVMERGPATNETGSTRVMRAVFEWMNDTAPQYLEGRDSLETEN
jgi:penicillin-binding protein 2